MVIVCSEPTVVDRLCVKRRLGVLVSTLWKESVQKHICVLCVLGLFLPSFRYIFCIAYIVNIVFIGYHFFPICIVRFTYNINFFWKFLEW